MAETKTAVNLTALYTELNKLGNNGDFVRASKVAKKSINISLIQFTTVYYFNPVYKTACKRLPATFHNDRISYYFLNV